MIETETSSEIVLPDTEHLIGLLRNATKGIDTARMNLHRQFPMQLLGELGRCGIFGAHISHHNGGLGLSPSSILRIVEQAAAIDFGLSTFLVLHYTSTLPIAAHAKKDHLAQLLPDLASGRFFAALALTEPAAGSNLRAMTTNFRPSRNGGYRIDGRKSWIGNGALAAILTCFARGPDDRISAFVVDKNARGIIVEPEIESLGLKALRQNPIRLDGVEVGRERLLGEEGTGLAVAEQSLSFGRLATGAIALGSVKRCIQIMARFASRRQINTGILLDNGVTRQRLARAHAAVTALDSMLELILSLQERGQRVPAEVSMLLKIAGSELLWGVVDDTLQLLGSRGYAEQNGVAALLRDTRFLRIAEGPTETLRAQVGAAIVHRESGLWTFFQQLDANALDQLSSLAIGLVESCPAAQTAILYDHIGDAALWTLARIAAERNTRAKETARRWIAHRLTESFQSARFFWTSIDPSTLDDMIEACDKSIGSLDETWPIAQQSRDPYLRRLFPTGSSAGTTPPSAPIASAMQRELRSVTDQPTQSPSIEWTPESPMVASFSANLEDLAVSRDKTPGQVVLSVYIAFLSRWANRDRITLHHAQIGDVVCRSEQIRIGVAEGASIDSILRSLGYSEACPAEPLETSRTIHLSCDGPMDRGVSVGFVSMTSDSTDIPVDLYAHTDLTLVCRWVDRTLSLTWFYSPLALAEATVQMRHKDFETFLAACLAEPAREVALLDTLDAAAGKRIVDAYSGQTTDPAGYRHTVQRLVEEQVDRTPDSPAIETPRERLTYRELDARANRLARCLSAGGLQRGETVAVMTSRSPSMVVGVLAALKAGGCFLIINSGHPIDRRRWVLAEAKARFVILDSATADDVSLTDARQIREEDVSGFDDNRPIAAASPEDVAYIVFTSGSTGQPKGVLVSHEAIANQLLARRDLLRLGSNERVLQAASPNFDIVVWELLGPLVFGGCIVMDGTGELNWDPVRVWQTIRQQRITAIQVVPSLLDALLDEIETKPEPSRTQVTLRHVICGGESLPRDVQARFHALGVGTLYNFYGPAEGAIDSTWWPCRPGFEGHAAPIGRAIPNRKLYVIDQLGQLVPFGFPGELAIGGVGIAKGYLHRPELTAERFLADPFADDPSARIYRTGDLVRFNACGDLEFLGRIDRQLKIRGVRIEPEEIELTISAHPGVSTCVVVVRETAGGEKCLAAYCVASAERYLIRDIRAYARQNLPAELVPSAFVFIDEMPKTSSGKVDPNALPPLDWTAFATEQGKPLNGPVEIALATIWADVLGVPVVDAEANFFELGGHSLTAIQVLSQIFKTFGVEIALSEFFNCPVIDVLAKRISAAPENMSELLADQRHQPADTGPLSYNQESLWYLDRLGESSAYSEFEGVRLRGFLDVHAFRGAIEDLLERHEILRTVLVEEDDSVRQVVRGSAPGAVTIVDISSQTQEEREHRLEELASQQAREPFDLTVGPLARFTLIILGPSEHVFLVNIHHVCGDGWSVNILRRELESLYSARVAGRDPDLPLVRTRYMEYTRQQRSELIGERLTRGVAWWAERLAGLSPLIELPLDRPRPPVQRLKGARRPFDLGAALTRQVRAVSRRHHVTPYVTMLTAFAILLQRYARSDDFAIGSPFANRRDLDHVIGYFANTVVLRADFSGDPTVAQLLDRFMRAASEANDYGHIPFAKVVEAFRPARDLSCNPIFQVMFSWQWGASLGDINLDGNSAQTLDVHTNRTKFDINVIASDSDTAGIKGRWEYDVDLFDGATIERMITQYVMILEQMVAAPERRVREIDLVADGERPALVTRWAVRADYPDDRPIVDLFAEQVARRPDAIAVVAEDGALTYRQLSDRSERLAWHLAARHIGPGKLVGVFTERSTDLVVAILGILRAGAAYVPVDPTFPSERVATIASDAELAAIVSHTSLLEKIPPAQDQVVVLDRDREEIAAAPETSCVPAAASDLAYVIYTSGSTGRPKGVQVEHRQVARLFAATDAWFRFGPDDVWSLFHSCAFDFSVWELWGALLRGGRVAIVPYQITRSPEEFYRFLVEHRITILNQTPSAFQQLSQAEGILGADPDLALRVVIFGGEALDFPTLGPWLERHGDEKPRLYNMYGITETTVHVTVRPLSAADVRNRSNSLIGVPIPDMELLILDDLLRPVPIGVPGELYVGGAGVARGYLNRPELNEARFVQHPFRHHHRLYRSGDLARARGDGDIEYIGRIDHQVQLRGFRVELGEIEAVLTAVPGVRAATVIVREDVLGDKRLVAYMTADSERIGAEALRSHLKTKLPSYMVPSALVTLDRFPLTSNGKLDRAALPRPGYAGSDRTPPRNETEVALKGLWTEVLGANAIGIRDNFFDLGGHSLLAVSLLSRVAGCMGRSLPLAAFLAEPTIEGMALALNSHERSFTPLVRLSNRIDVGPLFCFPGSGGMVQAFAPLAQRMENRSLVGVQRPGLDGGSKPYRTIEAMASAALGAILEAQPVGPYYIGGHSLGAWLAYELCLRLAEAGHRVGRLIVLDMPAPPRVPHGRSAESRSLLTRLLEIVESIYGVDTFASSHGIPADNDAERIDLLLDSLISCGAIPDRTGRDHIEAMLGVLQGDDQAQAAYAVTTTGTFPIALFRSNEIWDGCRCLLTAIGDESLGWKRLTHEKVLIIPVSGDHGTMLNAPNIDRLAWNIDEILL
jgi:amino acid adenylation domain-containing protein